MFEKGQSGNPSGRTKGSQNKTTKAIKEFIMQLLCDNMEQITEDLKSLDPKERLQIIVGLLPYVLPKTKVEVRNELNDWFDID